MTFEEAVGRVFAFKGIVGDDRGSRRFYVCRPNTASYHFWRPVVIDLETSTQVMILSSMSMPIPPEWKEILP